MAKSISVAVGEIETMLCGASASVEPASVSPPSPPHAPRARTRASRGTTNFLVGMSHLLSVEGRGDSPTAALPDEPPFLRELVRRNRLGAGDLARPRPGCGSGEPQLRDSAGFSPDFAARRRAAC